mmetsp:Transcript_22984/g.49896  ORF Transcript_22984/g.49896 Transcript_22984/m.49896 type:complete len:81 (+) Transcript_22984:362-604(+)
MTERLAADDDGDNTTGADDEEDGSSDDGRGGGEESRADGDGGGGRCGTCMNSPAHCAAEPFLSDIAAVFSATSLQYPIPI